jgi:hypothetical protein
VNPEPEVLALVFHPAVHAQPELHERRAVELGALLDRAAEARRAYPGRDAP